jgi:peptide/nickel transport system substrate-binding protein
MRQAPESIRTPLANGPFRIDTWTPGEQLILVRNEHYYRAAEGLPHLDQVTFRFTFSPEAIMDGLLEGTCHIGYQDGVDLNRMDELLAAGAEGTIVPHVVAANVYEHLDFGINPVEEYAATRPDWFEDVRVRQAMAQCVDRPALLETVYQGQGELLHAYVPEAHPLFPADGLVWGYDPATGNALLDEVGFLDRNGDGVREAMDSTRPFTVTLMTTAGSELRTMVAEQVAANLMGCGIQASVQAVDPQLFFAAGPEGPLFGRQYDLAIFAWLIHTIPACETYDSLQIPGPLPDYPAGWAGNNVSGWQNDAFDAACEQALASLPGSDAYVQAHQEALRIFMEQLPSLPLLPRLKASLVRPEVLNFHLDSSEPSELWNLFELDLLTEDGE